MNDEQQTRQLVDQLRHLVPGVSECETELEFIQSISNYILHLQAQLLLPKGDHHREVLRSLDSNQPFP